jgi:hypothetical protein
MTGTGAAAARSLPALLLIAGPPTCSRLACEAILATHGLRLAARPATVEWLSGTPMTTLFPPALDR